MAGNKIILCDTDILVEFYKNNHKIVKNLKLIGEENIAVSIVNLGELFQGALNKSELRQIRKDLENVKVFDIYPEICNSFKELLINYSLSHGLRVADAFIAATAIVNDIALYTLNLKDFRFVKGLKLHKPK